ncbi:protein-disulfide reductase DsbD [Paradevosia shaoguanensis]|uniref:protein-disulfide reductase DsbD n=1 Tax=Paradevosia shaoguanensis TaxID=1335043 RepID=UPI00362CADAD
MSIFRKLAAIALMALFVLAGPVGAQQAQPLPVEDAFKVSLMASGSGVEVVLNVAPGYYLYRDQISLADAEGQAVALQLPSGVTKDDPTFGRTEIFHDRLSFPLPEATAGKFILAYQGCKDGSICYPPVRRSLDADALAVGSVEGPSFLTESSEALGAATPIRVATETGGSLLTDLMGRGGALMVIGAFLAFGVALAFTPCVFPMYPILAGTLTQAGQRLSMPKAFGISLVYVLGMATAFGMLGLVAAWSGQNLQMVLQSPWAIGGVVVLFITLAISMFGAFELQLPSAWMTTISRVGGRNGAAGAAMMGFLSALIVGPCVTAPLAAALLYIAQTGDATLGAAALFALGIGKGIPLIVFGTVGGRVMPRAGAWMVRVKHAFGFVFLGGAIWMSERLLPAQLTTGAWSLLAATVAIYFIVVALGSNGVRRLVPTALGVAGLGLAGFTAMAAIGGQNPADMLTGRQSSLSGKEMVSETVSGIDALTVALEASDGQGRLVYLTADWCISCAVLDREIWTNPTALAGLNETRLIKLDVTKNTAEDQAMLSQLKAFGPPTLLFVDGSGAEVEATRLVGEFDIDAFRTQAQRAGFLP